MVATSDCAKVLQISWKIDPVLVLEAQTEAPMAAVIHQYRGIAVKIHIKEADHII